MLSGFFAQAGGQDQERKHKKRRGEVYSIQTSLIVAALKKMLPIGLNMCTPGDQELISLAKTRYGLVRLCGYEGNHPKTAYAEALTCCFHSASIRKIQMKR